MLSNKAETKGANMTRALVVKVELENTQSGEAAFVEITIPHGIIASVSPVFRATSVPAYQWICGKNTGNTASLLAAIDRARGTT